MVTINKNNKINMTNKTNKTNENRTGQTRISACKEVMSRHFRCFSAVHGHISRPFWFSARKGAGTLEIVIIIAVLISVALIFREALMHYATELIQSVFGDHSQIADLFIR